MSLIACYLIESDKLTSPQAALHAQLLSTCKLSALDQHATCKRHADQEPDWREI